VEAVKSKICSIQVKPIPGVANHGGTIVFGGGRTVLCIEEVQESQGSTQLNECGGVISSTIIPSNASKIYQNVL